MLADNDLLRTIVALGAAVTAVGAIWRFAIRPVLQGAKDIAVMSRTLGQIAAEFRPNHGSSLVDRLTTMQNELVEVRGLSSLAIDQHAVLADKVDEVIKRLDNE